MKYFVDATVSQKETCILNEADFAKDDVPQGRVVPLLSDVVKRKTQRAQREHLAAFLEMFDALANVPVLQCDAEEFLALLFTLQGRRNGHTNLQIAMNRNVSDVTFRLLHKIFTTAHRHHRTFLTALKAILHDLHDAVYPEKLVSPFESDNSSTVQKEILLVERKARRGEPLTDADTALALKHGMHEVLRQPAAAPGEPSADPPEGEEGREGGPAPTPPPSSSPPPPPQDDSMGDATEQQQQQEGGGKCEGEGGETEGETSPPEDPPAPPPPAAVEEIQKEEEVVVAEAAAVPCPTSNAPGALEADGVVVGAGLEGGAAVGEGVPEPYIGRGGLRITEKTFSLDHFLECDETRSHAVALLEGLDSSGVDISLFGSQSWEYVPRQMSAPCRIYRDFTCCPQRPAEPLTSRPCKTQVHFKTNIKVRSDIKYRFLFEGINWGTNQPINCVVVGSAGLQWDRIDQMSYFGWPDGWDSDTAATYTQGIQGVSQYFSSDGFVVVQLEARSLANVGMSASAWLTNHNYGCTFELHATWHHVNQRL